MVPGSTLRYGSHFWRVMRRPRLSSRQPIEAAATPFPREETTPPVTKMYFGPLGKALESLRWSRRTTHYGVKAHTCQIDRRKIILSEKKPYRRAQALRGWPSNFSTRATSEGTSTLTAS